MSELNELKVGDVVSSNDGFGWTSRLLKTNSDLWAFLHNVVDVGDDWQHGVHESLIPEGYAIVPIEPTDEMLHEGQLYNKHVLNYYKLDTREIYKAMIKASQSIIKK